MRALRLAARNPLLRYAPGPPHARFLRDRSRFRLLRAPNQSGKTVVGAADLIWHCLGRHPYQPVADRPIRAAVIAYSFEQSKVIQRKIHELLPDGVLDSRTHYDSVLGFRHRRIGFASGSTVRILTASQGTIALASDTLDYVWPDEPLPPDVYAELMARVTQTGGRVSMTMTPIGRPVGWLRAAVEEEGSPWSETHFGLSVANCPWMTQGMVDEATRACLPIERPQRIRGEWEGVTVDRLLDGFDEDTVSDEEPTGEVQVLLGADHGERPGSEVWVLLFAWRAGGAWHAHVWDEYQSRSRTTPEQDAEHVRRMLERHGLSLYDVDRARGDVNTAGKSHARWTVNEAFERAFAALAGGHRPFAIERPRKGPGSIMRAARVVNVALLDRRLRVHPRCERIIETMRHWTGADDDLKHPFDALGYITYDLLDPTDAPAHGRIAVT